MKKLLHIIPLIAVIMAMLVACTPTVTSQAKVGNKPWQAHRDFKSEKCTYKVTKSVGDGTENVSIDGILTYELSKISESECMLTMDFFITYGNSDLLDENFRNKTDTIHSEATFKASNLTAVHTVKRADIKSDPSLSYSYEVDYVNADENNKLGASFTDANGNVKQLKFDKGEYFDNDYLYYYVRALEKVSSSFSENINIINWYDSFLANKPVIYPLIARCSSTFENVKIENSTLFDRFIDAENETTIDKKNQLVGCLDVIILINGIKTGPELRVAYSRSNFKVDYPDDQKPSYAKLIPVKYKTRETISSGYTTFITEYNLVDYAITFN